MSTSAHGPRAQLPGTVLCGLSPRGPFGGGQSLKDSPLTAIHVLLLLAISALALSSRASAMEPDYRAFVAHCVKLMAEGEYTRMPKLIRYGKSDSVSAMGAAEARLWQWTGGIDYAARARSRIEAVLTHWEEGAAHGKRVHDVDSFFLKYPFLAAYRILLDTGQADEELTSRVVRFVDRTYRRQVRGNHNQIASRVAGQALALKLFPDSPMAAKWKAWIDLAWNDWYEDRDTTENAVNYNAIFFVNTFLIADLTGRAELMLDAHVRAMFERYRDQVSPSGVMPGYGDSSELASWQGWVAVFERCARIYRDPTFRWAAQRVFEAGRRYVPPRHSYHGSLPTFHMTYAEDWRDAGLGPSVPGSGASLLTRREPRDVEAPDKIVLSPSRTPGAPFAFVELYANRATHGKPEFGGGHAHPEYGSVEYYEVGGTMLLHSLGYNNRSPAHANIVIMRPPGQGFPLRTVPHTPNVWNEASLPTAAMAPFEEDRNRRSFDSITLRVPTGPVDFTVDDLRLSGPKGELLLDDFESGIQWRGGKKRELVSGMARGSQALRVSCGPGVTFVSRRFDMSFDVRDYTDFRFAWKYSNDKPSWARALIFRIRGMDYRCHYAQLFAKLIHASVSSHGEDSCGECRYGSYFTHDTTVHRRFVLTREGVLVVRDELRPGKDADGWTAGPLWHLWAKPRAGSNWFDAPAQNHYEKGKPADKRILVWMDQAEGREFAVQSVELWGRYKPFTVHARQTIEAARPAVFVSVLVPHDLKEDPQRLAAGIGVRTSAPGETTVSIALPSGRLDVEVWPRSSWGVVRK